MYYSAIKHYSGVIEINEVDALPTTEMEALLMRFNGEYVVFSSRTERGKIPLLEDEYIVKFPKDSIHANKYCRIRRLRPRERNKSIAEIERYELERCRKYCKHGILNVSVLWAPFKNKQN